jgi:methanesulfonate monooxygenase small subunit
MAEPAQPEDCERIRAAIARSGRLLDSGRWEEFVRLFAREGTYRIETWSAEIGREMTWMELERDELQTLFDEYPRHVRDPATRTHLITPEEVTVSAATATALSTFAVFRTDLKGDSAVYAVGSYEDEFVRDVDGWKLKSRRVRLNTRQFVTPTPLPL